MAKRLSLLIFLSIIATATMAIADDCIDACNADHDAATLACEGELYQSLDACEMLRDEDLAICDIEYQLCTDDCNDEDCLMECQMYLEGCIDSAMNSYGNCVMDAYDAQMICQEEADYDLEECLYNCSVPTEGSTWENIKARYRNNTE